MGRRTSLLAILLVPALLGAVAPVHATFPGPSGRIVYVSSVLWSVNPDGTGAMELGPRTVGTFGSKKFPDSSPDGNRIAFGTGDSEIWVMNSNGTGLREVVHDVPNCNYAFHPSWAPDGRRLVFDSSCAAGDRLFIVNDDGTGLQMLADTDAQRPVWSPLGDKIVFEMSSGLGIMNSDGTGVAPLTSDFDDRDADWSPDGAKLVFASRGANDLQSRIYVLDLSTGVRTPVTPDTGHVYDPTWSPDGTKIAYRDYDTNLIVINADGTDPAVLDSRAVYVDWSVQCTKNCSPAPPACIDGDAICGGDDSETIGGTPSGDTIYAGGGDDTVSGGGGNDSIFGQAGNDALTGGGGVDALSGGGGSDSLGGGAASDVLTGGDGNDVLDGGRRLDRINGGRGRDKCFFDSRREKRRMRSCEVKRFKRFR